MRQRLQVHFAVVVCIGIVLLNAPKAGAQVSDAVYNDVKQIIEDLITEEASQTVSTNLACLSTHRFVAYGTPGAIDITALGTDRLPLPTDKFVSLDAVNYFPRTLQATYDMKFASLRPIVTTEVSDFIADLAYRLLKAPPAVAGGNDTTKMRAFQATRQAVPAGAIQPANAHTFAPVPLSDDELTVCAGNLTAELAANQLANAGTILDSECAATQANRDEYACDVAYAIQSTLLGQSTDAQGDIERALSALVGEVALKKAPTDAQLTAVLAVVDTMLNTPKETTAAAVQTALQALTTLTGQDQTSMETLLVEMTNQWKALHVTSSKPVSIAAFANWMGGTATLVSDACTLAPAAKACTFFPRETSVLRIFWPIIGLAVSGDDVDAAQMAIGELFTELAKSCKGTDKAAKQVQSTSKDSCRMFPIYQRFLDATVVYVVEARSKGTPSDDARAALRTTTEDLIQEVGLQGGIDRRTVSWKGIVYPDLALRYEWSASNVNVGAGSGRAAASVTFLKFRIPLFYTRMGYSAITLSALDAIAPLAEIATRSTSATFDGNKLIANIIAPRADLEGGVPALSKHLLVGGGVSFRLAAPLLTMPATTTTPAAYEYQWCSHAGLRGNCFEFDLFVKYSI